MPAPLEYEGAKPDTGVGVTDHGDQLVISGPVPRPPTTRELAMIAAFYVSVAVAYLLFMSWSPSRGWRFKPSTIVVSVLVGLLPAAQLIYVRIRRRPHTIEVTAGGVTIVPTDPLAARTTYSREQIRRLLLVHEKPGKSALHLCTLRLSLRPDHSRIARLFQSTEAHLLSGPAADLRAIGARIRQVLDLPY